MTRYAPLGSQVYRSSVRLPLSIIECTLQPAHECTLHLIFINVFLIFWYWTLLFALHYVFFLRCQRRAAKLCFIVSATVTKRSLISSYQLLPSVLLPGLFFPLYNNLLKNCVHSTLQYELWSREACASTGRRGPSQVCEFSLRQLSLFNMSQFLIMACLLIYYFMSQPCTVVWWTCWEQLAA